MRQPSLTLPIALKVAEDGRIPLPSRFIQEFPWISGEERTSAWWLVIEPGRYRLLSEHQVNQSEALRKLSEALREPELSPDPQKEPYYVDSTDRAALPSRLISTTISPQKQEWHSKPGWRLNVSNLPPAETIAKGDVAYVWIVEGYPEVWSAQRYRESLQTPLADLLA